MDDDEQEQQINKDKEISREKAFSMNKNEKDIENEKKQNSYEECFQDFFTAFENKDYESIENTLQYLGCSSNNINFIEFSGFWSFQFISKLFFLLSEDPPPNVIGYIFNVLISIIGNSKELQVINLLNEEFFQNILPISSSENRKVIMRFLKFLESIALKSQKCRDILVENVPFDFFTSMYLNKSQEIKTEYESEEFNTEEMIKKQVLSIFLAISYFHNFSSIDLLSFILSILNGSEQISLGIVGKCLSIIYFLEMNDDSEEHVVLTTISIDLHIDYGQLITDLFFTQNQESIKDCEYLLKYLSDFITFQRNNDGIVPINLLVSLMKPSSGFNDLPYYLISFHSSILSLIDTIAIICDPRDDPFPHDLRILILSNCRDIMRDAPSSLKVKAAILVGSLINHLTASEMESIIEFQILLFIEPVLFMCNSNELLLILKWIFTLLNYQVDPQISSLIKYTIFHSKFSDTLDEVANIAEDEDNDEVVDLVSKLQLLVDFDSEIEHFKQEEEEEENEGD